MSAKPKIKNKSEKLVQELMKYYLEDSRPFAVGYSGGKDSSVTMDLVFKMLLRIKNPKKTVFVQFSDTLMEMDPVIEGINQSLVAMQVFIDKHNLPVVIQRVAPVITESFFVLLLGKGYQLPDTQNRWCTNRLKLRPQNRNIKHLGENFNGVVAVTGVRHAESVDRSNRIKRNTVDGMLKSHDNPLWSTLTPIEHMSADEIWSYIYTEALEWLDATTLGRQYAEAAGDGGECRTLLEGLEGEQAGCSKSARYGCWICPLFKKDKTLNNLTNQYDYMSKMEEFRNWLVSFKEDGWSDTRRVYKNSRQAKNFYTRDGHRKGMVTPSGYTMDWRKKVLERLWKLELEVRPFRKEPLITDAELVLIQEHWFIEGDLELTVEAITGKKLLERKYDKVKGLALFMKSFLYMEQPKHKYVWSEPYYKSIPFVTHTVTPRFITQLSIQLLETYELKKAMEIFIALIRETYYDKERADAHKILSSLPVYRMYHPSEQEELYIRKEWSEDKIGFIRFLDLYESGKIEKPNANLFGYDGDYGLHFEQLDELEEKQDITLCESISLADKMAWFD